MENVARLHHPQPGASDLQDWLPAAWYMTSQKHGLSALGREQLLGPGSYQTAWTMLHKLCTARGASRKRSSARLSSKWMKLMSAALNRGFAEARQAGNSSLGLPSKSCLPKGFGSIRLHRLHDVSDNSLIPFNCNAVELGAEVCTDIWKRYTTLAKQGYRHKSINVSHSADPALAFAARSECRSLDAQTLASGCASRIGYCTTSGCLPR